MRDMTKVHFTTNEAHEAARELDLRVTVNTVRSIAHKHGLTVHLGRV
jgi:hypothetical protein